MNLNTKCVNSVTPRAAWDVLSSQKHARLIDVRTKKEWMDDGIPDLSGIDNSVLLSSWLGIESQALFIKELHSHLTYLKFVKTHYLFFICRSGSRSMDAAVAASIAGYTEVFNVCPGFLYSQISDNENNADNRLGSWISEQLPWRYMSYAEI